MKVWLVKGGDTGSKDANFTDLIFSRYEDGEAWIRHEMNRLEARVRKYNSRMSEKFKTPSVRFKRENGFCMDVGDYTMYMKGVEVIERRWWKDE